MTPRRQLQMEIPLDVSLRVPADVAAAIAADTAGARRALEAGAADLMTRVVERETGYSDWSSAAPWCSGFWQVRQKSARSLANKEDEHLRMWFDAERQEWVWPGAAMAIPTPHAQFALSHVCRGLRSPWPEGYTYRVPGRRTRLLP